MTTMTVSAVYPAVAGLFSAVLAYSFLTHYHDMAGFEQAIASHRVVSDGRTRAYALLATLVEGLLSVGLLVEALARPTGSTVALAVAGALFGVFAAYLFFAARRVGDVDVECGCGALGRSLTRLAWLRPAGLLVVAMISVAALMLGTTDERTQLPERLTAATAAWVTGTIIMSLVDLRAMNSRSLQDARETYRLLRLGSAARLPETE